MGAAAKGVEMGARAPVMRGAGHLVAWPFGRLVGMTK
jgi:hypothetical protein